MGTEGFEGEGWEPDDGVRWYNPFSWLSGLTGSGAAANAAASANNRSLGALDKWYQQSRSDLAPFRELDLEARRKYMGAWEGLSPADLDRYYEQAWQQSERDINTAAGKSGNYGAGAWRKAITNARVGLGAQQARDKQEFGFRKLAALQGGFSGAGAQQAQMSGGMGGPVAGLYTRGGEIASAAAMAPWQNLMGLGALALPAVGAYYGSRGG